MIQNITIEISKEEVKEQLGYQKHTVSNQQIEDSIAELIQDAQSVINPQGNYIKLENISIKGEKINLGEGKLLFNSQDIARLLSNQSQVALLAVTIGPEIEKKVTDLFSNNQLTKATILDAIGSVAVEEAANQLNEMIAKEAKKIGLSSVTMRYSPGYGDFDLDIQPQLLDLLQGQELGIETNDSFLLIPQKSITALIGLGQEKNNVQPRCDFNCHDCNYDTCTYK